jgi:hypothetical protein
MTLAFAVTIGILWIVLSPQKDGGRDSSKDPVDSAEPIKINQHRVPEFTPSWRDAARKNDAPGMV